MPDHFYVYPSYLRKKGSRASGRRVPADLAVGEVSLEAILAAAQQLGYKAELEAGKAYPREAHLHEGRVKVTKKAKRSKAGVLRELAQALRAAGAGAPASGKA